MTASLRLMGKKLLVSLAMEGKLQGEGLQSMDEDDDMLTAMARELVTKQGVGEQAAEVWKALTKGRETAVDTSATENCPTATSGEIPTVTDEPKTWIPSDGPGVQLSLF